MKYTIKCDNCDYTEHTKNSKMARYLPIIHAVNNGGGHSCKTISEPEAVDDV